MILKIYIYIKHYQLINLWFCLLSRNPEKKQVMLNSNYQHGAISKKSNDNFT